MKKQLAILLILIISQIHAQFGPQQIVSTEVFGTSSVVTADLDGDGDMDILSESDVIAWYENLDGLGQFGAEQIIYQNELDHGFDAKAADIDGDGDLDVLTGIWADFPGFGKIAWHENLDGQGDFGDQIIIDQIPTPTTVIPVDFDNDDDFDILLVDRNNNKIAWYRNLDGLGNFGFQHIISIELDWPVKAVVEDIDGDGDIDILASAFDGDQIGWFENTNGNGSFSGFHIISTEVDSPTNVFLADIDQDNDLDALSTSVTDNKIAWYENLDGQGTFGPQILISDIITEPFTLFVQDLDNDDDMDIVSSFWDNGLSSIIWLENLDGLGTFSSPILISEEISYATSLFASDLDQDQDFDVLSSSQLDHKVAWYENYTILESKDNFVGKISIFPIPANDIIFIDNTRNIEITSIKLYDVLGRQIKNMEGDVDQVDVSHLNSGVMIVVIETDQGIVTKKIIKE